MRPRSVGEGVNALYRACIVGLACPCQGPCFSRKGDSKLHADF